MLEISYYYITLTSTVIFLLLQYFFKLEVSTPIEELDERDPLR